VYLKAGGDPAAACNTSKERVRTTGPPVAKSRLTTHAATSVLVSFVCSGRSCLRGVRGIVPPRLWVLGELVSIRSVFPRPTLRDTVSNQTAAAFWVPSMQGIQQAIQTSLKPLRHSLAVRIFERVPLQCWLCLSPELAPRAKQKVSASQSLRGKGRCERWVLPDAAGGSRGVRCKANVSPGIQPGDRQHADGRFIFGVGAGASMVRWDRKVCRDM
jgi:hypothetical protein